MNSDSMKQVVRWSWLAVAAAVLYAGITLLLRWRETRSMEEAAERQQTAADRKLLERLGNGELKVLAFYASPRVVARGSRALLCYGVSNAAKVKISPGLEALHPSLSRCVEVKPRTSTTYTLTATDRQGRTLTQTAQIAVQ